MTFRAIILNKSENIPFTANIENISQNELMLQKKDTLVKIHYSCLNYKDALALTDTGPVVRQWPMIPGIDGVGSIVASQNDCLKIGQQVIINGFGCGETHWGCLSEFAALSSSWLIPLPDDLTTWQSMAIGTAGYTAALAVLKIINEGITPDQGDIIVTGATGGVGSIAIMLLSSLGYSVFASTSKLHKESYLKKLGAKALIDANSNKEKGKVLQKERWIAAIDVVGSHTLANICAQTRYGGMVVACGLAQGMDFPSSVAPFILRGVTLAGIDSVMAPIEMRKKAWEFIGKNINPILLEEITHTISMEECFEISNTIISGQICGRYVVDLLPGDIKTL